MTDPFAEPEQDTDADHMVETPESLRDDDPEVMPMDRGNEASDRPLGAEKYGTTHAEEAQGESLDMRIAQERPDVGEHDPIDDIVAADPTAFGNDPTGADQVDEALLADAYGDQSTTGSGEATGRIVEPDEGAHTDVDKDAIGRAVGRDGGDLSAEEAALHIEEG